jgi:hypothetical protein
VDSSDSSSWVGTNDFRGRLEGMSPDTLLSG